MKYLTDDNKIILLIAIMAFCCEYNYNSIPIIIPTIVNSLNADFILSNWASLAFNLFSVSVGLMCTKIVIRIGLMRSLRIGFYLLFITAILLTIPNIYLVIFCKAIQGIVCALFFVLIYLLMYKQLDKNKIIFALSVLSLAGFISVIGVPIICGFIITNYTIYTVFLIIIPFIIVALLLAFSFKNEWVEDKKIDKIGSILSFFGFTFFIYGLSTISKIENAIFLIVGIIMIISFIKYELHYDEPLYDFRLLKNKFHGINNFFSINMLIIRAGVMFPIPLYLQYTEGFSPFITGIIISLVPISSLITTFFVEKMINKTDEMTIVKYGLFITFLGCIWFSISAFLPKILFFIPLILIGSGGAMFEIPNKKVVLESAPSNKFNDATSFLNFGRDFGVLLAITFMTTIVNSLAEYLQDIPLLWYSTTDIIITFIGILSLINIILYRLFIHKTKYPIN